MSGQGHSAGEYGQQLLRVIDGMGEDGIVSIWRMRGNRWRVERSRGIGLTVAVTEDEDLVEAMERVATCMGKK